MTTSSKIALRLEAVPKPVLITFAIIVAVKLGVLLAFGPASQYDTTDYVGYADAILSGDFHHVDLATDPMPITLAGPSAIRRSSRRQRSSPDPIGAGPSCYFSTRLRF